MKLKVFEELVIPEEVKEFYDDLADKYLKSTYEYGKVDTGEITSEFIGRYCMSQNEIYIVDESIDLSYLLHCEEGNIKQDELVLYYDKYIRLKELENLIIQYANEVYIVPDIKYMEVNKEVVDLKEKPSQINVTVAGLFLASHLFGTRKLKKFFDKEIAYCKDSYPISWYIDDKKYDISFITGDIKSKIVLPKVNEKEKKEMKDENIQVSDEFIGQNEKSIVDQIKDTLGKQDISDILNKIGIGKKLNLDDVKKMLNIPNEEKDKEKNFLIEDNENNKERIKKKFENEYKNDYSKYVENTTNAKIDKKEKPAMNEILKAVDKKKQDIINQKGFNQFRNLGNNNTMKIIDFLYLICSNSRDPLQTLEDSLSFLSIKYEENYIPNIKGIVKNYFVSKVKNMIIDKVNEKMNLDFSHIDNKYLTSLGLADVDDIKFNFEFMEFSRYFKTKEYRFMRLFINSNNIKRSYSLDENGRRIFKRARRLLDNLLISLISSMNKLNNNNYDGIKDDRSNILRNYILYLDEYLDGIDIEEYKFLIKSEKPFNISNMFLHLLKSNKDYRDKSLCNISDNMFEKTYFKYTKDNGEKDKIKSIFPTKSSLEYNMRLRSSYNIYKFYEDIYNIDNSSEKDYFVCNKAKIKCTMSVGNSVLIVKDSSKYIDNKAVANIEDKQIVPFSMCNTNRVCVPHLSNWEKKNDILIKNKNALMSSSKCICTFGGTISIVDPNQQKSYIKNIDNLDKKIKYNIDDYVDIKKSYKFLKDTFFSVLGRNVFTYSENIENIDRIAYHNMTNILKPKIDEKKLCSNNCIPAVNTEIDAIINAYNLIEIIKGYFYGRRKDKKHNSKYINIGKAYSNIVSFDDFITKALNQLDILYSPYKIEKLENTKATWMIKAFSEYDKRYTGKELNNKIVIYHREGGGIKADYRTPWCASFVN